MNEERSYQIKNLQKRVAELEAEKMDWWTTPDMERVKDKRIAELEAELDEAIVDISKGALELGTARAALKDRNKRIAELEVHERELLEENYLKITRIAELETALSGNWDEKGEGLCPLCNIIQDREDVKRAAQDKRIAELEAENIALKTALRKIVESKVYCNPLKDIARKALEEE